MQRRAKVPRAPPPPRPRAAAAAARLEAEPRLEALGEEQQPARQLPEPLLERERLREHHADARDLLLEQLHQIPLQPLELAVLALPRGLCVCVSCRSAPFGIKPLLGLCC